MSLATREQKDVTADFALCRAGCDRTALPGEEVIDTYICKKTSPFGTRLFIKSGDYLLSHKSLQYHRPKLNEGD